MLDKVMRYLRGVSSGRGTEAIDRSNDAEFVLVLGRLPMLVLSRKIGESIQIAGGIRVTVTEVRGGRVRLSIEAPADVRVLRKEIADCSARLPEAMLPEAELPSDSDR